MYSLEEVCIDSRKKMAAYVETFMVDLSRVVSHLEAFRKMTDVWP
jgi:hypothetical protein